MHYQHRYASVVSTSLGYSRMENVLWKESGACVLYWIQPLEIDRRGRFLPNMLSSAAFMAYGLRYGPCETPYILIDTHFCLESLASSSFMNTVYRGQNQTS